MDKFDFREESRNYVREFDGFYNAHAHGDRAFTYKDEYYEHVALAVSDVERLSLNEKQSLVWALHTGKAFTEDCIEERLERLIKESIKARVREIDTTIDVTYNTNLSSWNIAERLKAKYTDKICLKLGAYNVAGFKDSAPERFEIFEEAAHKADFLVALAEKDRKQGHIGEKQHNVYMLRKGIELKKPVQFHVGQANTPEDRGAELLFECMDWTYNILFRLRKEEYPKNMLVHDISAACYSEEEFEKHCEKIKQFNLGVICCPSAGISMKPNRKFNVPIHNSIARVWDYAIREIPVSIGTDNINDVFVPSSFPDLFYEINILANSLRFYNPRILAKIACGKELDNFDRGRIRRAIYE